MLVDFFVVFDVIKEFFGFEFIFFDKLDVFIIVIVCGDMIVFIVKDYFFVLVVVNVVEFNIVFKKIKEVKGDGFVDLIVEYLVFILVILSVMVICVVVVLNFLLFFFVIVGIVVCIMVSVVIFILFIKVL